MKRALAINALANWSALGTTLIVGFLVTPYMLHHLGDAAYGLWVLMASFGGYYSMLDLGTRNAMLRAVAGFAAVNDSASLNDAVKTAVSFYAGIGTLVFFLTCGIAYEFDAIFHLPPALSATAKQLVLVFGFGLALEFPMTVFGSIVEGMQKFVTMAKLQTSTVVIRATLIVIALHLGYGVVTVAFITISANLIAGLIKVRVAHHALPALRVRLGWSKHHAVAIGSFGVFTFWIGIAELLRYQTDSVVIGAFMAVEGITIFSIAAKLTSYFIDGVQSLANIFTPLFSHLNARGEQDALRRTLILANKSSSLVAFPMGVLLWTLGPALIRAWVGPHYAESGLLLRILIVPIALYVAQAGTSRVLYGIGRPRMLAAVVLVEALANLAISVALIGRYGLVGVALGTSVPLLATSVLFLPAHVCRAVGLRMRTYLTEAHGVPLLLTLPLAAVTTLLNMEFPPASYLGIVVEGVTALGVYGATLLYYFTSLQGDLEGRATVRRALAKALGR